MKTIVVLERDESYFGQIKQAATTADPDAQVVRHNDVQEFFGWLKQVITSSKEGGKKPNIVLFIVEMDILTDKLNVQLLGKMQQTLVSAGLTDPESPAGFILTTFKSTFQEFRKHIHPAVLNIVHKPFEKMTFLEFIKIALKGRSKIQTDMYQHDSDVVLELVKEIPLVAVSEIGFRTIARRSIETGKIAKYYSNHFGDDKDQAPFVFAYCHSVEEKGPEEFHCSFRFFGTPLEQLRKIRINIQQAKQKDSKSLASAPEAELNKQKNVLVITVDPESFNETKAKIEDRFDNVQIHHASNLEDYEAGDAPTGLEVNAVFVHEEIHKAHELELLKKYVSDNCKPQAGLKFYALSEVGIDDYDKLERYVEYADYFTTPLDRFYFSRKMKQHHPDWRVKGNEELLRDVVSVDDVIKTGLPVTVKKIAETSLSLMYNREMPPATLRTFMLPSVDEGTVEEITAMCHYSEKLEKELFQNDFVFVGVTDAQQKFIRKWMLQKYTASKNQGG